MMIHGQSSQTTQYCHQAYVVNVKGRLSFTKAVIISVGNVVELDHDAFYIVCCNDNRWITWWENQWVHCFICSLSNLTKSHTIALPLAKDDRSLLDTYNRGIWAVIPNYSKMPYGVCGQCEQERPYMRLDYLCGECRVG